MKEMIRNYKEDHLYQILSGKQPRPPKQMVKPKTIEELEKEEEDKAWGYFVRTGDFSLVNDLREQRRLSAFYMNRWD